MHWLILAGLPALASCVGGCSVAGSAPDAQTLPVLHFAETEIDAGEITARDAQSRTFQFRFANRGPGVLRIESVTTGCGCVMTGVEGSPLGTGDMGRINVRIKQSTPLSREASLVVVSNDPVNSPVTLRLTWRIVSPVEARPDRLDFGTVLAGEEREATVEVLRTAQEDNPDDCRIERIEVLPNDRVSVGLLDGANLPVDISMRRTFRVQLLAGGAMGPQSAAVHFHISDCVTERATLFIFWTVRQRVEVVPRRVSLGIAEPGGRAAGAVVVSTGDDEPLEISDARIHGWHDPAHVSQSRLTPGRIRVRVELQLPQAPGAHNGELLLRCTRPEARELRIPISAFVAEEASR